MSRKIGDGLIGEERRLVVVGCVLEPSVRSRLKRMAREADRSVASIVRDLINEALQQRGQLSDQQATAAAPSYQ